MKTHIHSAINLIELRLNDCYIKENHMELHHSKPHPSHNCCYPSTGHQLNGNQGPLISN